METLIFLGITVYAVAGLWAIAHHGIANPPLEMPKRWNELPGLAKIRRIEIRFNPDKDPIGNACKNNFVACALVLIIGYSIAGAAHRYGVNDEGTGSNPPFDLGESNEDSSELIPYSPAYNVPLPPPPNSTVMNRGNGSPALLPPAPTGNTGPGNNRSGSLPPNSTVMTGYGPLTLPPPSPTSPIMPIPPNSTVYGHP